MQAITRQVHDENSGWWDGYCGAEFPATGITLSVPAGSITSIDIIQDRNGAEMHLIHEGSWLNLTASADAPFAGIEEVGRAILQAQLSPDALRILGFVDC